MIRRSIYLILEDRTASILRMQKLKFSYDKYYPPKVWSTTILIGSILSGVIYRQVIAKDDNIEIFWLIPMIIAAATPIFIPTFLLSLFTYIISQKKSARYIKLITTGITLGGYLLSSYILGFNFFDFNEYTTLLSPFLLTHVIASIAYKITRLKKEQEVDTLEV